ncbi:hypothetical protein O7632_08880 [Solwaraspora sp. WMMD406]|uniref:hypothetical protein n=1 Tax=Solwaraspora sp. WMMD406 TaxID=3016095 RepID=UPI002417E0C1|nr:hypothetical protein [Solwaraspora sp. WMMD406]MDG4764217.1 hypothetical protein [Solwaraspora sp. WMMD406]
MAERKKVLLRLDPAVHEAIAKWAADDLRSVNAQIEYALRLALRAAGRPPRAGAGGAASEGGSETGGRPAAGGVPGQHQDPGEE